VYEKRWKLNGNKNNRQSEALYFFEIAKAIIKKVSLASYFLFLFFERNVFIEPPLSENVFCFLFYFREEEEN